MNYIDTYHNVNSDNVTHKTPTSVGDLTFDIWTKIFVFLLYPLDYLNTKQYTDDIPRSDFRFGFDADTTTTHYQNIPLSIRTSDKKENEIYGGKKLYYLDRHREFPLNLKLTSKKHYFYVSALKNEDNGMGWDYVIQYMFNNVIMNDILCSCDIMTNENDSLYAHLDDNYGNVHKKQNTTDNSFVFDIKTVIFSLLSSQNLSRKSDIIMVFHTLALSVVDYIEGRMKEEGSKRLSFIEYFFYCFFQMMTKNNFYINILKDFRYISSNNSNVETVFICCIDFYNRCRINWINKCYAHLYIKTMFNFYKSFADNHKRTILAGEYQHMFNARIIFPIYDNYKVEHEFCYEKDSQNVTKGPGYMVVEDKSESCHCCIDGKPVCFICGTILRKSNLLFHKITLYSHFASAKEDDHEYQTKDEEEIFCKNDKDISFIHICSPQCLLSYILSDISVSIKQDDVINKKDRNTLNDINNRGFFYPSFLTLLFIKILSKDNLCNDMTSVYKEDISQNGTYCRSCNRFKMCSMFECIFGYSMCKYVEHMERVYAKYFGNFLLDNHNMLPSYKDKHYTNNSNDLGIDINSYSKLMKDIVSVFKLARNNTRMMIAFPIKIPFIYS